MATQNEAIDDLTKIVKALEGKNNDYTDDEINKVNEEIAKKAELDLSNINVGVANAGKFFQTSATGGLELVNAPSGGGAGWTTITDLWTNTDKFKKYKGNEIRLTLIDTVNNTDSSIILNCSETGLLGYQNVFGTSFSVINDGQTTMTTFSLSIIETKPDLIFQSTTDDPNSIVSLTISKVEVR